MVLIKPANIPHCAKNSQKCVGNSDVSSSVQDFHRLHFEIVTSAAASTPKEVRAYPQRGSGPVSQAHLERGLRLDLITSRSRLSTANNSPYQHCGHCRPGAYPMLGVQLPSPLSFLPMVESLVTQLENVVISSLSCFCFDLLNCVYNRLFYMEVVH